jgi:uncharacterized protein YjbI with pentapeptide repeats
MVKGRVDRGISHWPVSISATADVACGARLWWSGGQRRMTVVAKSTFALVHGSTMLPAPAARLRLGDHHDAGRPDRSVVGASDMALYLPRADVMFVGSAHAQSPTTALAVRLALFSLGREGAPPRALVDKTLHVYGERDWATDGQATEAASFQSMPIAWESTARGPAGYDLNPVGRTLAPGYPLPTVADPSDPAQPAGFGPISASWAERRRLLRGLDPNSLDLAEPTIPDTFAWSYFHAAPADQRCGFLEGNEWLVLQGLDATHARLESQLPFARARVRAVGLDASGPREITLKADTLLVEGDRGTCSVTWRGNLELTSAIDPTRVRLFAALEHSGRTIDWPAEVALDRAPPSLLDRAALEAKIAAHLANVAAPSATAQHLGALPEVLATTTTSADDLELPARERAPTIDYIEQPRRRPSLVEEPDPNSSTAIRVAASWLEPSSSPAGSNLAATSPLAHDVSHSALATSDVPLPAGAPGARTTTSPVVSARAESVDHPRLEPASRTPTRIGIYDEPTFVPGPEQIEGLVAHPEARPAVDTSPPPPDSRKTLPPPQLDPRAVRHTMRGLGLRTLSVALAPMPPRPEPPAASDHELTKNIAIPESLLELARSGERVDPARAASARSEVDAAPSPAIGAMAQTATAVASEASQEHSTPVVPPAAARVQATFVETSGPVEEEEEELPPETRATFARPWLEEAQAAELEVDLGETRAEVERLLARGESLAGTDLSDLDLDGFDLSERSLAGARLDRASLRGANLSGANLEASSLEGAILEGALLDRAKLVGANLVGAKLVRASLRGVELTDANLTTADAREAVFESATGDRVVLSRARLDGASFECAQLYGVDLSEAFLRNASLEGAIFPEANGCELDASGARMSRALFEYARLEGADLSGATLERVDATGAVFDRAVLEGANLSEATIESASFVRANLTSARLRGAHARDARFDHALLVSADLREADLDGAVLDDADVRNAKMS